MNIKKFEIEITEDDIMQLIYDTLYSKYFVEDRELYHEKLKVEKINGKYIASVK